MDPHPQDYIQLWHGDADLLRESLEAVQQTAAVILGGIARASPRASGTRRSGHNTAKPAPVQTSGGVRTCTPRFVLSLK